MSELTEKQKEQARREALKMAEELKLKKIIKKLEETKSVVENLDEGIKFYFDAECTQPIQKVQWNEGFRATMISGEEKILPNTIESGGVATATFYVKNETKYKFGVRELKFPDKRVIISITNDWLMPMVPVKVGLVISTAESAAKGVTEAAVESAQLTINGFFVIE